MFRNESEAPFLYKSVKEKDLYGDIAKDLIQKHSFLKEFAAKKVRLIIKIKCLSMLNGGGLKTASHISHLIQSEFPGDLDKVKNITGKLCNILSSLPIVREFHDHGSFIYQNNKVALLTHADYVAFPDNPHKLNSPVMCSVETVAMTYLMGFIGVFDFKFLPLASIHDGIVLASRLEVTPKIIKKFNQQWEIFFREKMNFDLPVKFTLVGEPFTSLSKE